MMGLPCVTASKADLERLIALCEEQPQTEVVVDLRDMKLRAGAMTIAIALPDATRSALLSGNWDATGLLVDHYEQVERVAANLPYVSGF
jgi:3-isopropylmalate/(R)-2-methylmalate dehydratase small subunit